MIKKKVLVIDDSLENLEGAEEQLGQVYDLTTACKFSQAAELMKKEDFDIVLTDVFMPAEVKGLGDNEVIFAGQDISYGLTAALLALNHGVPEIHIVSDTDHHSHPIAWALDALIWGDVVKVHCGSSCPKMDNGAKDWAAVLAQQQQYYTADPEEGDI